MKRLGRMLLCAALALCLCAPLALAAGDSEAELRALLSSTCGEEIVEFYYGDYDGDGSFEAFAFVGAGEENSYQGDVWFVSAAGARELQSDIAYPYFELRGNPPTLLFLAEDGRSKSWSYSYMWLVFDGYPVATKYDPNRRVSNPEIYEYRFATDATDDGNGSTWKRYYFYLDEGAKREYGGIYISLDNLYEFEGARELVEKYLKGGCVVSSIIYRSNGVINVNFDRGMDNLNLSLRYDGTRVTYWEEDAGVYLPASIPIIAVYPKAFVHPAGMPSTQDPAQTPGPLLPVTTGPMQDGGFAHTIGDVYLRDEPSLSGSALCMVPGGSTLVYLGDSSIDARGVIWHLVRYGDFGGWGSSKYVELG